MTFFRATRVALCVILLDAIYLDVSQAGENDKNATVTFNQHVEIPGVHLRGWEILRPGTYVFKLVNSDAGRHIVQILNQDRTRVYASILVVPNDRLTPSDKTVTTFSEGVRGKPEPIRAWFYPDASRGYEFAYAKSRAADLAKATNLPVLSVETDLKADAPKPDDQAVITALQRASLALIQPTGEAVGVGEVLQAAPSPVPDRIAAVAPSPPPTSAGAKSSADHVRYLRVIALGALLVIGGAIVIRRMRKRAR